MSFRKISQGSDQRIGGRLLERIEPKDLDMRITPTDVCHALVQKARLLNSSSPFTPEVEMAAEAIRTALSADRTNATTIGPTTIYVIDCVDNDDFNKRQIVGARRTEREAKIFAQSFCKTSIEGRDLTRSTCQITAVELR